MWIMIGHIISAVEAQDSSARLQQGIPDQYMDGVCIINSQSCYTMCREEKGWGKEWKSLLILISFVSLIPKNTLGRCCRGPLFLGRMRRCVIYLFSRARLGVSELGTDETEKDRKSEEPTRACRDKPWHRAQQLLQHSAPTMTPYWHYRGCPVFSSHRLLSLARLHHRGTPGNVKKGKMTLNSQRKSLSHREASCQSSTFK